MKFIYQKSFVIFASGFVLLSVLFIMQKVGWLQPVEYALLQAPRPVVAVFRFIAEPVRTVFVTLTSMDDIVKQNAELAEKVVQLTEQKALNDRLQIENELLRTELQFKKKSPHQLESCTVLSIDPQEISDTMVLNCGAGSGVKEGQGVVSNGYLIGKIVYVGDYTSTVLLITNGQSSVDAQSSKTSVQGVVKGSYGSGMVFDLVSQNAEIAPGDLIVTAGINNLIPKDILIGQVGQEISEANDLFKKLSIISPVQLRSLDYVFVIK